MLLTVTALIDTLRHLKLLSDDRLNEAARDFAGNSAREAADGLVALGRLTAYQADELCEGRGGGLVVGEYVLQERIGAGGMGEVFRAWHRVLKREAALKRILTMRLGTSWAEGRFRREVEAAARLSHPNVVQVYDAGMVRDAHYLAMELLRGENLAQLLARRGRLTVAEAVDYVRQTCLGMQHAFERGLVHRDLKPENLMLCGDAVKILDLGLALVSNASTVTQLGQFFGTPDYVAPEQVTNFHEVDVRADVDSLGCTLYCLLAGVPPFHEAHPAARSWMHQTTEPKLIEERRPEVSAKVAAAVRKMMAKRREGRYQTPGETAEALGTLLRSLVAAPPAASPQVEEQVPATIPPQRPAEVPQFVGGETFENSIGMKFVLVPAGAFWMGATRAEDDEAFASEGPRHEVRITKAFWMGVHPVTQKQWKAVMGSNPSYFCASGGGADRVRGLDTDDFPVEQVSWRDVTAFLEELKALSEESRNRRGYRLPTEAEWEYSCRNSGPYQKYHFGNTLSHEQANFGSELGRTSRVGSYAPNERGLYDMHGNVWEWCADRYGPYAEEPVSDPSGPPSGPYRVFRGGSWGSVAGSCRCAYRGRGGPEGRLQLLGFRAALVPAP